LHHRLLPRTIEFAIESYDSAKLRYGAKFAHDLFVRLESDLPQVSASLNFYRPTTHQTEDVYAVYDVNRTSFVVQLDPELEHIIIWNGEEHVELCAAYADPSAMAIEYIRDDLLNQSA